MLVSQETREMIDFFLKVFGTAISTAGMVLIVNVITQHLPKNFDIIMNIIIGLIFVASGSVIAMFVKNRNI